MARLAMSEFSTLRWSLEQEIREYARHGIREIGLWRTKLSDLDADAAADLLYSREMRVSSLSWAGGFTGSCGMSHRDAIVDAAAAIRTAARIGAECLIVHPGNPVRHTRSHARRLLTMAINELLPLAIDYGVCLGIEIMNRRDATGWTIFDSDDEAIEFVLEFPTNNLGLVLDLYHVGCSETMLSHVPRIAQRIALVQLSDRAGSDENPQRCFPGEGMVPVQRWFNTLEDSGFQGTWECEIFGQDIGPARYRDLLNDVVAGFSAMQHQRAVSRGVTAS